MVAFAKEYLPAQSPARSQNRAECFFAQASARAAHGAPAVRLNAGENSRCRYDACRGASLAQRDEDLFWKQVEMENKIAQVSDGVDALIAQPDRNPMVNLAGMRQKDDLRNLGLVSAQIVIPATGLAGPKLAAEFRSVTLAFRATQVQLSEALSYGITYNINQALAAPITFAAQAGELYFYGAGASFSAGFRYPDIGNTPLGSPGDMLWWANQGAAARNAWDNTFGGP